MDIWIISGILGFIGGGAAVWFGREPITKWYKGAEDFIGDLEKQAQSLRQRLK